MEIEKKECGEDCKWYAEAMSPDSDRCTHFQRGEAERWCSAFEPILPPQGMDTFESGATRTPLEGKLSYLRALSPAVQRRYVQYLAKHRQTADGPREFDNWKKGIPRDRYMDSMYRHVMDATLVYFGYTPSDPAYDLEELLCAIRFNVDGLLFELIHNRDRDEPSFREQLGKDQT